MALKAGYKGIKEVGPGLDYDNTTGLLTLDGESSLKLDNLEDVSIDTPLGGDVLQYDSTNDEWTNETPDTEPIEDSPQLITSGAVYAGLKTEDDKISAIWSSNARTGVKNIFNPYNVYARNYAGETVTDKGKSIRVLSTQSHTSCFVRWSINVTPNTDYRIVGNIDYTSGECVINIKKGSDTTTIKNSDTYTSDGTLDVAFNSGDETTILVAIYVTSTTAAIGDVTFEDFMVVLASDTDTTYGPFAMTNGELTEKVQGIIDAANNAADFAAFKTAIGNL